MEPHVSIIILNWNTWKDTIECLESVLKSNYKNFTVFLVDNHSSNDSVQKIEQWAKGELKEKIKTNFLNLVYPLVQKPLSILKVQHPFSDEDTDKIKSSIQGSIVLIENKENLGFAKGNNVAIDIALKTKPNEYIYLLNNDTVIEKNCLSELVNAGTNNKVLGVISSTVYHYFKKNEIAQAGGRLRFWGKSYYFTRIKNNQELPITFVNGCASMIHKAILVQFGYLTEDFFFGEEDFDFSLRMKKNKIKMVSVANSKVYHKIETSAENFFGQRYKKAFVHRLNRLVNMKKYLPFFVWILWKYISLVYFFLDNDRRFKTGYKKSFLLVKKMNFSATAFDDVKKDKVEWIFNNI